MLPSYHLTPGWHRLTPFASSSVSIERVRCSGGKISFVEDCRRDFWCRHCASLAFCHSSRNFANRYTWNLLHDTSCLFIATLAKQTLDGRSPFSRKWSGYPMRRSSHSRHPLARKFGWPSWQWRLERAAQLQGLSCQNVEVEEQRNSNGSDETELKEDNVIWWYLMNGTDQGRAVLWGGPALMYSKT